MAARIAQEFIDQLLARIDIVELIGARVPLRKAGREFIACCPFHSEKTPSFTVSPGKQFFHCFGCGAHGTVIGFLMEYEHLGFLDAVEDLARSVGLELPRGSVTMQEAHNGLLELVAQADHFFRRQLKEHPAADKAIGYLRNKRGLSGEIVKTFGIGYAPPGWDNLTRYLIGQGIKLKDLTAAGLAVEKNGGGAYDRFRDRIMFPIRDRRGRTIAFGARSLGDDEPKYLNSAENAFFHKGRELYGLYEARTTQRRLRRLLVVEGYMDVVALAQYGISYGVATLGTATTTEHVERLFRTVSEAFFCFDGDQAGRKAAWRALENTLPQLRDGRQVGFLFLPEGEDPDSLVRKEGREAFEQRLDKAVPLSDYFFEHLSAQVDMNRLDGRARFVEEARPLLERLPDSVFRDMMIGRLAERVGMEKKTVGRRVASPPTPAPVDHKLRNAALTRTPLRQAVALLLNRPELAQLAGDTGRFAGIDEPGLPLVLELIEILRRNPHINTAALLERYRQRPEERILQRLAEWKSDLSEDHLESEFLGSLKRLEERYSSDRMLLEQLARGEISMDKLSQEQKDLLRTSAQRSESKYPIS